MTGWTEDEMADAHRDAAALVRLAAPDASPADVEAILDGAGDRGVRCAAVALAGLAYGLLVRATVAAALIEDDQARDQVMTGIDVDRFLANPDTRSAVEASLAGLQAATLGADE